MKQERLKILGLLEEGKITADDAAMLLEKLGQSDNHHFFSDDTAEQVEEKLHRFAKNAEHFAKEFCEKAGEAYKDVEPKLKKASQTVLEKTAAIVDDISHYLHDSIESAKAKAEEACSEAADDTPKPN
ncbi:MAG: hypothetical protein FWD03_00090 [Defluviitaleaceae bacterium]|nr:hypothetical protein [Defluviitaleaceae bacterium]